MSYDQLERLENSMHEASIYCISCKKMDEIVYFSAREAAHAEAHYRYCDVCYACAAACKTETFSLADLLWAGARSARNTRKPDGCEFDSPESDSDVEHGEREDAFLARLPTARRSARGRRPLRR